MTDLWQHLFNVSVCASLYWLHHRVGRLEEKRRLHDLDDVIRELGIDTDDEGRPTR